tara:strand:+ start:300 stop:731 length:432 start_codon:yes stop_codon:yes gene_type:complete
MSTAILDIQKAKLAGIQDVVTAISSTRSDAPSPYINTHHFSPGIYIRAFYGIKGSVVVSQIHLHEHITILAAGHCRVVSTMQNEERIDVYKDFAIMTTPPHTKRALYFLENTTIITVHQNPDDCRDIPELEKRLVVDSFEEII